MARHFGRFLPMPCFPPMQKEKPGEDSRQEERGDRYEDNIS